MKRVCRNIEKLNEDKSIVVWYDEEREREKIERTKELYYQSKMEKGIKEGVKQGIEQNKLNIAKKMLEEKIDISTINKITGLSTDILKKL